jgi:hypothetical protein
MPLFWPLSLLLVPKQLEIHKDFVPLRRNAAKAGKQVSCTSTFAYSYQAIIKQK